MTRQMNNYYFIPSPDAPAVSVIMPVYNGRKFVRHAIDSILNQTFRDLEFIIVDDASDDGTWELLERYGDERIVLIRQGARSGPYPARNRALRIARGEFIAMMDSDDVSHPERLEREMEFLRANPDVALVGTCYRLIDERGAEKSRWKVLLSNDEIKGELPKRNWFCGPSVMFRRACLREVGLFDERFRFAADYDMWLRIAGKFNVANIDEFLFDYREHDAQITTAHRPEQDEYVRMIQSRTAPPEINDGQPLGSVVIPTKNRPELVTGAIESALGQTAGDIEVIVINDGGDEAAAVLPRRGDVTYVSSRRCRGLAASRNTGAKLARGEYICFLDDDDVLYPEHFQTLIEAMNREGLPVAYSNSEKALIEKTHDGYRIVGREPREQHPFDRKQMLVMNYIPVHNLVFRRECLDKAGIFDENLVIHEDWDMWVRLSQNYDFVPVYKTTADVRWWRDKTSLTFTRRAPSIGAMRAIYRKYAALTENDAETRRRQRHCLRAVIKEVRALREERGSDAEEPRRAGREGSDSPSLNHEEKIGVILLTMEDSDDTIECLASLARVKRAGVEIILIGNGSSDECIKRIRHRFPDINIIRSAENLGFSGGCNLGIRAAVEELDCTYILLLNNDTVVEPNMLDEMLSTFNSAPDIAAVGAKIFFYDEPDIIDHVGGVMDPVTGTGTHEGIFEKDAGQYEAIRECDYITGAALFTSAEILEKVGLLDPAYFLYFEDTDWCARARAEGMRVVVNPRARVRHKISRTMGSLLALYVDARNRGLYVWKNYPQNFDRFVESYARDMVRLLRKFEKEKAYSKILAVVMGLDDFCRGNFGKGRIDEARRMDPRFRPPLRTHARLRRFVMLARRAPLSLEKRIRRMVRQGKERWPTSMTSETMSGGGKYEGENERLEATATT